MDAAGAAALGPLIGQGLYVAETNRNKPKLPKTEINRKYQKIELFSNDF